jgi:hypothetical protein
MAADCICRRPTETKPQKSLRARRAAGRCHFTAALRPAVYRDSIRLRRRLCVRSAIEDESLSSSLASSQSDTRNGRACDEILLLSWRALASGGVAGMGRGGLLLSSVGGSDEDADRSADVHRRVRSPRRRPRARALALVACGPRTFRDGFNRTITSVDVV